MKKLRIADIKASEVLSKKERKNTVGGTVKRSDCFFCFNKLIGDMVQCCESSSSFQCNPNYLTSCSGSI
ncbi:hypothetical protein [uncultured Acetobacteroides sp.]|uniref:hypothetical protein n=1 Tax=uncultured Acetobacteroides sp. TaxID=1760811 RepID=UPI0029F56AAC|nr:hypothetical protein [uncultured Acetobacteroides sp.]